MVTAKNRLFVILVVTNFLILFSSPSSGKVVFLDNFDREAPDEGSPNNFFSFGTSLSSVVVNPRKVSTPPNATILTMNFLPRTWGGGMLVNHFEPTDYEGAILSAKICASQDLSNKPPMFAFRAEDEDGTILRATGENMFKPGEDFQTFSLPISALDQVDAWGADAQLNASRIVSFGFCFYNAEGIDGVVHFYIDDITVTVPDGNIITADPSRTLTTR